MTLLPHPGWCPWLWPGPSTPAPRAEQRKSSPPCSRGLGCPGPSRSSVLSGRHGPPTPDTSCGLPPMEFIAGLIITSQGSQRHATSPSNLTPPPLSSHPHPRYTGPLRLSRGTLLIQSQGLQPGALPSTSRRGGHCLCPSIPPQLHPHLQEELPSPKPRPLCSVSDGISTSPVLQLCGGSLLSPDLQLPEGTDYLDTALAPWCVVKARDGAMIPRWSFLTPVPLPSGRGA